MAIKFGFERQQRNTPNKFFFIVHIFIIQVEKQEYCISP